MLGLIHDQVWIGSKDSIIYIIDTASMSCNQQLTEHRQEVTSMAVDPQPQNGRSGLFCISRFTFRVARANVTLLHILYISNLIPQSADVLVQ